jgi:hypothetical protein
MKPTSESIRFAEESKEFSIGLSVRQGKPECGHS